MDAGRVHEEIRKYLAGGREWERDELISKLKAQYPDLTDDLLNSVWGALNEDVDIRMPNENTAQMDVMDGIQVIRQYADPSSQAPRALTNENQTMTLELLSEAGYAGDHQLSIINALGIAAKDFGYIFKTFERYGLVKHHGVYVMWKGKRDKKESRKLTKHLYLTCFAPDLVESGRVGDFSPTHPCAALFAIIFTLSQSPGGKAMEIRELAAAVQTKLRSMGAAGPTVRGRPTEFEYTPEEDCMWDLVVLEAEHIIVSEATSTTGGAPLNPVSGGTGKRKLRQNTKIWLSMAPGLAPGGEEGGGEGVGVDEGVSQPLALEPEVTPRVTPRRAMHVRPSKRKAIHATPGRDEDDEGLMNGGRQRMTNRHANPFMTRVSMRVPRIVAMCEKIKASGPEGLAFSEGDGKVCASLFIPRMRQIHKAVTTINQIMDPTERAARRSDLPLILVSDVSPEGVREYRLFHTDYCTDEVPNVMGGAPVSDKGMIHRTQSKFKKAIKAVLTDLPIGVGVTRSDIGRAITVQDVRQAGAVDPTSFKELAGRPLAEAMPDAVRAGIDAGDLYGADGLVCLASKVEVDIDDEPLPLQPMLLTGDAPGASVDAHMKWESVAAVVHEILAKNRVIPTETIECLMMLSTDVILSLSDSSPTLTSAFRTFLSAHSGPTIDLPPVAVGLISTMPILRRRLNSIKILLTSLGLADPTPAGLTVRPTYRFPATQYLDTATDTPVPINTASIPALGRYIERACVQTVLGFRAKRRQVVESGGDPTTVPRLISLTDNEGRTLPSNVFKHRFWTTDVLQRSVVRKVFPGMKAPGHRRGEPMMMADVETFDQLSKTPLIDLPRHATRPKNAPQHLTLPMPYDVSQHPATDTDADTTDDVGGVVDVDDIPRPLHRLLVALCNRSRTFPKSNPLGALMMKSLAENIKEAVPNANSAKLARMAAAALIHSTPDRSYHHTVHTKWRTAALDHVIGLSLSGVAMFEILSKGEPLLVVSKLAERYQRLGGEAMQGYLRVFPSINALPLPPPAARSTLPALLPPDVLMVNAGQGLGLTPYHPELVMTGITRGKPGLSIDTLSSMYSTTESLVRHDLLASHPHIRRRLMILLKAEFGPDHTHVTGPAIEAMVAHDPHVGEVATWMVRNKTLTKRKTHKRCKVTVSGQHMPFMMSGDARLTFCPRIPRDSAALSSSAEEFTIPQDSIKFIATARIAQRDPLLATSGTLLRSTDLTCDRLLAIMDAVITRGAVTVDMPPRDLAHVTDVTALTPTALVEPPSLAAGGQQYLASDTHVNPTVLPEEFRTMTPAAHHWRLTQLGMIVTAKNLDVADLLDVFIAIVDPTPTPPTPLLGRAWPLLAVGLAVDVPGHITRTLSAVWSPEAIASTLPAAVLTTPDPIAVTELHTLDGDIDGVLTDHLMVTIRDMVASMPGVSFSSVLRQFQTLTPATAVTLLDVMVMEGSITATASRTEAMTIWGGGESWEVNVPDVATFIDAHLEEFRWDDVHSNGVEEAVDLRFYPTVDVLNLAYDE